MMELETTLRGIELKNPLLPASGPLTNDDERMIYFAREAGLGAIVTKTISVKGAEVTRPCIVNRSQIIGNCEAWTEFPMEKWTDEFIPRTRKSIDVPLIASVGYTAREIEEVASRIEKLVDGFECVPAFHDGGKEDEALISSISTLRGITKKPIWIKMNPCMPNAVQFTETCMDAGADGIVACGSLGPSLFIDLKKRQPIMGNGGFVWISGPAIKPVNMATVRMVKKAIPEVSIIGCGGVESAEDVIEYLLAGADAVEMLSAAMMKGKTLFARILDRLPETLKKYGFSSIDDVKEHRVTDNVTRLEPHYPVIDRSACSKCGLCADNCPYFALAMDSGNVKVNQAKCFGCGLCQSKCPRKAISNVY